MRKEVKNRPVDWKTATNKTIFCTFVKKVSIYGSVNPLSCVI